MDPAIVPGTGAGRLGEEIAGLLGGIPVDYRSARFPDGELDVAVEPVISGMDTYVVQSLSPPVNDRLVELLLILDACRRESPKRLTAVVPYLGYARKDRRTADGEAVSLSVLSRLLDDWLPAPFVVVGVAGILTRTISALSGLAADTYV